MATHKFVPTNITGENQDQFFDAVTVGGNIKGFLYHEEASVDLATITDGAGVTQSVTVPGVELGDMVLGVSFGVDLADVTVTAYVQAADTVEVRVQNESGSNVDLSSTTIRLYIADVT